MMNTRLFLRACLAAVLFILMHGVMANDKDYDTRHAKIPALFHSIATENNIPPPIFYSLILQESRRPSFIAGHGSIAWPWTINDRGRAYYFNSKEEAVNHASSLLSSGIESFDIGYGQVNWKYHGHRFQSIAAAFDPLTNLQVSATILTEQKQREECNTWALALGCYHRPRRNKNDIRIATNYAERVVSIWLSLYE